MSRNIPKTSTWLPRAIARLCHQVRAYPRTVGDWSELTDREAVVNATRLINILAIIGAPEPAIELVSLGNKRDPDQGVKITCTRGNDVVLQAELHAGGNITLKADELLAESAGCWEANDATSILSTLEMLCGLREPHQDASQPGSHITLTLNEGQE